MPQDLEMDSVYMNLPVISLHAQVILFSEPWVIFKSKRRSYM